MKKFLLMAAMAVLFLLPRTALATDHTYFWFWQKWDREQAEQRKIDAALDDLDKQAPSDFDGTAGQTGQRSIPWGTTSGKRSRN